MSAEVVTAPVVLSGCHCSCGGAVGMTSSRVGGSSVVDAASADPYPSPSSSPVTSTRAVCRASQSLCRTPFGPLLGVSISARGRVLINWDGHERLHAKEYSALKDFWFPLLLTNITSLNTALDIQSTTPCSQQSFWPPSQALFLHLPTSYLPSV